MTTVILCAGGKGSRFGAPLPKQFTLLKEKPLVLYSFEFFLNLDVIKEIIVVAEKPYHKLFKTDKTLHFAEPGLRRQDSVFSGLLKVSKDSNLICIHDAARPFLRKTCVYELLQNAKKFGASTLAVPVTSTIKELDDQKKVVKTLAREKLWDIQTPQAIQKDLLIKAYQMAHEQDWEVTDDVSLIEKLGEQVVITPGHPETFKVTTPFDLQLAELILCQKNTN